MPKPHFSVRMRVFLVLLPRFLGAAAAPVIAFAAGAYFLVVPAQTADLLAGADPWQFAWFYLALFLWALSCWFWARWSLNLLPVLDPEVDGRPAAAGMEPALKAQHRAAAGPGAWIRTWLPRALFLAAPLFALGATLRAPNGGWRLTQPAWAQTGWTWLGGVDRLLPWLWVPVNLALAGVVAALGVRFAMRRHEWSPPFDHDLRQEPFRIAPEDTWRRVLRQCVDRLPFGPASLPAWVVLFLGFCALVWASPVGVPGALGAPAAALVGAALATGVLTAATVIPQRAFGVPAFAVLVAVAWLTGEYLDNHALRALPAGGGATAATGAAREGPSGPGAGQPRQPEARPTLAEAFAQWRAACAPTGPVVLVATAGGASRAALWTASVLHQVEAAVGPAAFRRSLFAISGVSGGSLGAAAYVASLPRGGCTDADSDAADRQGRVAAFLRREFLAPPVAGYMTLDLLARIAPLSWLPDRAAALERGWEGAWLAEWPRDGRQGPAFGRFDDSFLGLWLAPGSAAGARMARPGVPLLLLNGVEADTGFPALTAPVKVQRNEFQLAVDLLHELGRDVRLSTAVTNSARFPFVTPAGTLNDAGGGYRGRVVDGGYVDNFGADTIRDVIRTIRRSDRKLDVVVVQISSDPSLAHSPKDSAVPRCGDPPASPLRLNPERTPQVLSDAVGPLLAVVQTRSVQGLRAAGDLAAGMCDGAEPETEARRRSYFHFALCNEEDGAGNELPVAGLGRQQDFIPLNWALSTPASDFIAPPRPAAGRPSAMDHCGNAEELRELRSRLQGGRPLVSR